MIQLANEFTAADDDACGSLPASDVPTQARRNNSTKRKTAPEEKQSADMVATTFAGRGEGRQRGRGRGAGRGQQRGSETNSAPLRVPQTYEEYRDMPFLIHLDANGKATHTNRHCKFVNDLKEDSESGYKRSRKNRPRGKGKGKKEEESKDSSERDEDVDPKHAAKSDDKRKNPFVKKAQVYHTFLGTPTV